MERSKLRLERERYRLISKLPRIGGPLILLLVAVLTLLWFGTAPVVVEARSLKLSASQSPAQQTSDIRAVVRSGGASLLDAPGGNVVAELPVGDNLTAFGRTADSTWTAVRTSNGVTGWVATGGILMFGGSQLPAMAAGARLDQAGVVNGPVVLPTPTATPPVTATPLPTPTTVMAALPANTPSRLAGEVAEQGQSEPASQVAVVRSGGATLLDAPNGAALTTLATGTALTAVGRTEDTGWLAVITPQRDRGWVPAPSVVSFNADRLPVLATSMPASMGTETVLEGTSGPVSASQEKPPSIAEAGGSVAAEVESAETVPGLPADAESSVTATVAVTDSRLNVRSGPDVAYRILAKALPGQQYAAVGRSADSSWIQITGDALGTGYGWVAAEFVALTAPVETLPVVEADFAPAPTAPNAPTTGVSLPVAPVTSARPVQQALSGNLVVQTSLGGEFYVVDLATGASRYLVSGLDPAISPDGSTVAFTRGGGDNGLFLIDIDGSNERRIYSGGEDLRSPTWSPDGSFIVFSRLSGSYECRDVGFGICLPDNPFLRSFDLSRRPEFGLSRVNTDGGDFRDLPALTSAQAPSWNDIGIVYQSNTGIEITEDTPDGTTRKVVGAPYYQDPDWQPGTDRIAFQSREGSHWEIFTIAQDGNGLYALTKPVTTLVDELPSNVAPAWSPDGQHVVYLSNRNDRNSAGAWRLWVMNADGGDQRPLGIDLDIDYTYSVEQVVDWGVTPGS